MLLQLLSLATLQVHWGALQQLCQQEQQGAPVKVLLRMVGRWWMCLKQSCMMSIGYMSALLLLPFDPVCIVMALLSGLTATWLLSWLLWLLLSVCNSTWQPHQHILMQTHEAMSYHYETHVQAEYYQH